MTGERWAALAVIVVCLAAMGVVLALGRPDTDDARSRIRDEWRAANGEDAPRPWGSDRGSVPGIVLAAALLLLALAFAAGQADRATTPDSGARCDLPVQSECP